MPQRIPTFKTPRLRSASVAEATRPNAYQRGYTDKRHQAWRLAVLARDAWQCVRCQAVCSGKGQAHADHASPVVPGTDHCRDGRSRYDVAGGQTLCASCHQSKTNAEMRSN